MIYLLIKILLTSITIICFNSLWNIVPIPVKIETPVSESELIKSEIRKDLIALNAPINKISQITEAVYIAHKCTGIDYKLIIALMKTESNFNENAIGPKNRTKIRYKGLMQTPTMSSFNDVDVLHGARILEQKLKIANNDLQLALALYKGGNNSIAHKQAKNVIEIYNSLKEGGQKDVS